MRSNGDFVCHPGVRIAVLMSWQERLAGLRTLGHHGSALRAGLSILTAANAAHLGSQPVHGAAEANDSAAVSAADDPWPSQGGGADMAAVSQALTSLLNGHVAAVLGSSTASGEAQVRHTLGADTNSSISDHSGPAKARWPVLSTLFRSWTTRMLPLQCRLHLWHGQMPPRTSRWASASCYAPPMSCGQTSSRDTRKRVAARYSCSVCSPASSPGSCPARHQRSCR